MLILFLLFSVASHISSGFGCDPHTHHDYELNNWDALKKTAKSNMTVFFHVSKTGGSSMCAFCSASGICDSHNQDMNCKVRYNGAPQGNTTCSSAKAISKYLDDARKRKNNTFVMMENDQGLFRCKLTMFIRPSFRFFTMLREPLSHRWSVANFFPVMPIKREQHKPPPYMSFSDWMQRFGGMHWLVNETYTRLFADLSLTDAVAQKHANIAKITLTHMNMVLTTTDCDNIVELACIITNARDQGACGRLDYPAVRVSSANRSMTKADVDAIRPLIVFDIQVYKHARKITPCFNKKNLS